MAGRGINVCNFYSDYFKENSVFLLKWLDEKLKDHNMPVRIKYIEYDDDAGGVRFSLVDSTGNEF